MNSLHTFDRSLDKFLAWLSEAESSLEAMESMADADRLGQRTSRDGREAGRDAAVQHQRQLKVGVTVKTGNAAEFPALELISIIL